MRAGTIRAWAWVHTWSSLVCTVFMLLLAVTGLPLIFGHEIDALTGGEAVLPAVPAHTQPVSADVLMAQALAQQPQHVPLYVAWDDEHPRQMSTTTALAPDVGVGDMQDARWDALTGQPITNEAASEGVMMLLYRLHTDLYLGLPGTLFLGAMGLLLLVALVSGAVLYAPFMRKLPFGALRPGQRTRWLDWHNLLGMAGLAWLLVVGATGAINTLGQPLVSLWQTTTAAPYFVGASAQPPRRPEASVQQAIDTARAAVPGAVLAFVAYPGTPFASNDLYMVMLRGATPLTKRLGHVVLVNAHTGALVGTPHMPAWIKALLLSQPLHFGDYAGLPLKILWALLDAAAIVVLWSGLLLWWRRRRMVAP